MTASQTSHLDDVQLFHGPFSPMRADLYARIPNLSPTDGYRLEGEVYGPLCESSRTLPARARLVDSGGGQTVLARAVVADPCPWSATVPAYYRVRLCLSAGDERLEQRDHTFGFLAAGVAGRRLYRAGQPWVLTALTGGDDVRSIAWEDWRAAELTMIVENPSDECCLWAARHGVPLVAIAEPARSPLGTEIRRLAKSVSVAIVILPGETLDFDPHDIAPNLLFGQELPVGGEGGWADWADLLLVDSTDAGMMVSADCEESRALLVQFI
ncbi:MAG: hypothetical protein JJ992_00170 [Planctomycetes bacterium]|nr:hypothetical protein [Planctomycetota bacterium]